MGDVIQLLDSISVERRDRHDGKKHTFELCIVYPDYMDEDNRIVKCKNEEDMNDLYTTILENLQEVICCYENQKRVRK